MNSSDRYGMAGTRRLRRSLAKPVESSDERWLIWTLASAVVAFGLGVIGFARYQPDEPWPDLVYHSLQLFVLGSDPIDDNGPPYNLALEIARFLAPATTIYGIFRLARAIMRDRLHRRAVARLKGHLVVTGDGPSSLVLAENLHRTDIVVLVGNDHTQAARRQGIPVVQGDPRQPITLEAAGLRGASQLFACGPDTATNTAVVLAAGSVAGRKRRLSALARVGSDQLVEALRVRELSAATRAGDLSTDFFCLEDIAARELLAACRPIPPVVEIVGFQSFGRAVLRALARDTGDGAASTIVIRSDEAEPIRDLQHAQAAANRAAGGRPRVITYLPRQPAPDTELSELVLVCLSSEDDALNTALQAARSEWRPRVVLCLFRESPFKKALQETPGLDIFGILDAACKPELLTQDAIIARAARAIHRRYIEMCAAAGETVQSNSSMKPWDELPTFLQDSNYAQAEHIGAKLNELGCRIITDPPDPEFVYQGDEVEELAIMEHRRWVAERTEAGFVFGPTREGNKHPDLRPWDDLDKRTRDKDRDAVRNLPALLARAGLYLARRSPPPVVRGAARR